MDTNTLQVIEKFGDKMDAYIQAAADKAGMAVEYFWPLFVRQQYIEGVTNLCLMVFSALLAVGLLTIGKGDRFTDCEPTFFGMRSIVGGIMFIPVAVGLCAHLSVCISAIANPEYAAFRDLLSQIK